QHTVRFFQTTEVLPILLIGAYVPTDVSIEQPESLSAGPATHASPPDSITTTSCPSGQSSECGAIGTSTQPRLRLPSKTILRRGTALTPPIVSRRRSKAALRIAPPNGQPLPSSPPVNG